MFTYEHSLGICMYMIIKNIVTVCRSSKLLIMNAISKTKSKQMEKPSRFPTLRRPSYHCCIPSFTISTALFASTHVSGGNRPVT